MHATVMTAEALLELQGRLARATHPDEQVRLARELPGSLVGLAPELQRLLAELYLNVWTGPSGHVLPDWRAAEPLPAVARAWLRVELMLAPRLDGLATPLLLAALRSLTGSELREPVTLLPGLCAHADAEVAGEGLRLVYEALIAGLIAPALAARQLVVLLNCGSVAVKTGALQRLAEPWAAGLPCPRAALLPLMAADELELALAATRLAGLHELHADLRALAEDPDADPELRRDAFLQGMTGCARGAVGEWIGLAVEDPPLFAPACLAALRAQHRRGVFIGDGDVDGLLALVAGDHTLDLRELAALAFTSRHALMSRLQATPVGDPRWRRFLPLLLAQGSSEAAALVCELLAATDDPPLRRRLIAALGELSDAAGEDSLLAELEREPRLCLASLRAVGGAATVSQLRRDLGLDDDAGVRAYLQRDVAAAVSLLWHLLADDEPGRDALYARLRAAGLPAEIRSDLGGTTPLERLPLLLAGVAEPQAVSALTRLIDHGSPAALPLVRDLLRRVLSEVVASTLIDRDGAGARPEPGARPSEAERQIPANVLLAVKGIGARLFTRGAIRPACLLAAKSAAEAGPLLLAELLLDLAEETDEPEGLAIVLAALTALPDPRIRRVVHRHLRHRAPVVRAAAVRCLASHGADDLCASLIRLVQADDLPTARQAIIALAGVRATAAAGTIAGYLEHPNMNLKKAAAEALQRAGGPVAVPAIVRWLGLHDNPGLRAALSTALTQIVGEATTATLLAGLDAVPIDADANRRWRLLVGALDRSLTPAAVLAAARRAPPWLSCLLAALAGGAIELRSGSLAELAALLHVYGLPGEPGLTPPQYRPAVQALLERGLGDEVATSLLSDAEALTPHERTAVRPYLREWLAALAGPHAEGALALVLQLASDARADERALLAGAIALLAARLDDGPREPLLAVIDAVIPSLDAAAGWRLAARLRASTPRPNLSFRSWLARLRRCGAVLTRADLERALHDCAGTPDPARLEREVLRDALAVGPPDADELPLQEWAREQLRAGAGAALLHTDLSPRLLVDLYPACPAELRSAWLDHLLALQPIDVPRHRRPAAAQPQHRPPPRSRATLEHWLARLAAPTLEQREQAASHLLAWPEPAAREAVLASYLAGQVELTVPLRRSLATTLADNFNNWCRAAEEDLALRGRLLALLPTLGEACLLDEAPRLISWYEQGPRVQSVVVATALRGVDAGRLLPFLAGHEGCDALLGPRAPASPGPLLAPGERDTAVATLAELRTPLARPVDQTISPRERLESGDPEQIRHALTDMSHAPGDEWIALLDGFVDHPSPRVRLHAHRLLRASGEREAYLRCTCRLLDDDSADIQRMAIRALSHGGYEPAVPGLVERLARDHDPLHAEVVAALRRLGPLARDALVRGRSRARPDRRARHDELLADIAADARRRDAPPAV